MSQIIDHLPVFGMKENELQDTLRAALIAEAEDEDWEISPEAVKALTEKYSGQEFPLFMSDINKGTSGNSHIEALQELLYGDDTTPESRARGFKEAGNECFEEGRKRPDRFENAKEFYSQGISQKCSNVALNSVLYSNRAMTHLMTKDYVACVDDCREAIKLDPLNHKPYYRAAKASYYLRLFKQAAAFGQQGLHTLHNAPRPDTSEATVTIGTGGGVGTTASGGGTTTGGGTNASGGTTTTGGGTTASGGGTTTGGGTNASGGTTTTGGGTTASGGGTTT
eukprot:Lankesteria_metandrocarpae@DN9971_c0_g1_i1.p1